LLFLVDAQLPPSLADALRAAGRQAVLVTKDRDFSVFRATGDTGPVILWIRIGIQTIER
jgi:predicted nuclease of predicted toxin-antitoxin system